LLRCLQQRHQQILHQSLQRSHYNLMPNNRFILDQYLEVYYHPQVLDHYHKFYSHIL
jgi:hypothetical protein